MSEPGDWQPTPQANATSWAQVVSPQSYHCGCFTEGFTAFVSLRWCMPGRTPVPPPGPPPGWRPPLPPGPPPRRSRSRSPLEERESHLLGIHRENVQRRRGGRQAKARTRGIHRNLLNIFKERILRLLTVLVAGSERAPALHLRVRQIDERLTFLQNNWPEDKRDVLPSLRSYISDTQSSQQRDTIIVESESEAESICNSEESELEEGCIRRPQCEGLRELFDRLLVAKGRLTEIKPGQFKTSVSDPRVEPQRIPELPAHLRGGSRVGGSSSSKAAPTPKVAPSVGPSVPRPKVPPLQPTPKGRPKSAPTSRDIPTEASSSTGSSIPLGRLPQGSEIAHHFRLLSRFPNHPRKCVISFDYHNVLDKLTLTRRETLRNDSAGLVHQRVRQVLQVLRRDCDLLILSYCHIEETRQRVKRAFEYPGFADLQIPVCITDKPTGPKGKLAFLRAVCDGRLLQENPPRVYHIDDSPDVLQEIFESGDSIIPVGVRLDRPRYRRIEGVHYGWNALDCIEHVLEREHDRTQ